MSSQQIESNKANTVEHGIEIDADVWKKINTIGLGVLVKNTERSRNDAGGI